MIAYRCNHLYFNYMGISWLGTATALCPDMSSRPNVEAHVIPIFAHRNLIVPPKCGVVTATQSGKVSLLYKGKMNITPRHFVDFPF